jgi:hypothetical protein
MAVTYENTYWNNKGKHEDLVVEIAKLIPSVGEVKDADANRALETYRIAQNCYYDLYNNGLCNRAAEFRRAFGFSGTKLMERHAGLGYLLTQEVIDLTETRMDEIILAAYAEQFPDIEVASKIALQRDLAKQFPWITDDPTGGQDALKDLADWIQEHFTRKA